MFEFPSSRRYWDGQVNLDWKKLRTNTYQHNMNQNISFSMKCMWKCHLQYDNFFLCRNMLTHLVLKPKYTWITVTTIPWMLMSLFLTKPSTMMTSSNGNIFRVTGPLCGEFTGPRWIPTQRPVTQSFDVYFDLRKNKRLGKQSWGWWFGTLSWSLLRHRNDQWIELCSTNVSLCKMCKNLHIFLINT